jgi:DNA invertase Pin-like site-specific DNA recombinase
MAQGEVYGMATDTAVYVRVSGDTQTLDQQRKEVLAEVPRGRGRPLLFEEVASGGDDSRPQYQKVKALIKSGQLKHLYCWSYDRLGRNGREIRAFVDLCWEHGCQLRTVKEQIDLSGPFAPVIVAIIATMAEMERNRIRERTRAKLRHYKEQYGWKGHGSPPADDWLLDKVLSKVPLIHAGHKAGVSIRQLAKQLNLSIKSVQKVIAKGPDFRWQTRAEWCREHPDWYRTPQSYGAPPSSRSIDKERRKPKQ